MNEMEQSNVTTDAVHRTQDRQADRIQILTTLNETYLPRLQVLLTSIRASQPEETADIWLMHSGIPQEDLEPVARNYNTYLLRSGGRSLQLITRLFIFQPVYVSFSSRFTADCNARQQDQREDNACQHPGLQVVAHRAGHHAYQRRSSRAADVSAQCKKGEHSCSSLRQRSGRPAECPRPHDPH